MTTVKGLWPQSPVLVKLPASKITSGRKNGAWIQLMTNWRTRRRPFHPARIKKEQQRDQPNNLIIVEVRCAPTFADIGYNGASTPRFYMRRSILVPFPGPDATTLPLTVCSRLRGNLYGHRCCPRPDKTSSERDIINLPRPLGEKSVRLALHHSSSSFMVHLLLLWFARAEQVCVVDQVNEGKVCDGLGLDGAKALGRVGVSFVENNNGTGQKEG